MPDLDFQVTGVEAVVRGLAPLLHFKVAVHNSPKSQPIASVLLHAQIQIECPCRPYTAGEKEKLVELFGEPSRWGQTLRNRLWASCNATVPAFNGATEAILPMPCTFDMNLAATKYFTALEGGEVPLLFLFSGSIFYQGDDGRLQVHRISWNKESVFKMPIAAWRGMMNEHFPNSSWLCLNQEIFDRLHAYKRRRGFVTWEETVASLLSEDTKMSIAV